MYNVVGSRDAFAFSTDTHQWIVEDERPSISMKEKRKAAMSARMPRPTPKLNEGLPLMSLPIMHIGE
jgi:hypothetical protein